MVALRLCKAGYGSPRDILGWTAEEVLTALQYEGMLTDYEAAFLKMNAPEKK